MLDIGDIRIRRRARSDEYRAVRVKYVPYEAKYSRVWELITQLCVGKPQGAHFRPGRIEYVRKVSIGVASVDAEFEPLGMRILDAKIGSQPGRTRQIIAFSPGTGVANDLCLE